MRKGKRGDKAGVGLSRPFQDAFEASFDSVAEAKLRVRTERDHDLRSRYKLKELLGQITTENCHPQVDWGRQLERKFLMTIGRDECVP